MGGCRRCRRYQHYHQTTENLLASAAVLLIWAVITSGISVSQGSKEISMPHLISTTNILPQQSALALCQFCLF
jgi:hypothetical protein